MKKKRKKQSRRGLTKNLFAKLIPLLLAMFLIFALVFLILSLIDFAAPCLARLPHNISGSVWFSVIGNLLGAIPSIMISLLAIRQSREIQKLQEKLHRPELALKHAVLSEQCVNWPEYKQSTEYKKLMTKERNEVDEYISRCNNNNYGLLRLQMNLVLRNDVYVNEIKIKKIIFEIKNESYTFQRDIRISECPQFHKFKENIEDGLECYEIDQTLINFFPDKEDIWDEIYMAINAEKIGNPCYQEFLMKIFLKITFGYNTRRSEKAVLSARFVSGIPSGIHNGTPVAHALMEKSCFKYINIHNIKGKRNSKNL